MILWITGQSQSGKTTLAKKLISGQKNVIHLDGDETRKIWPGLSMSKEDRFEQCVRIARLAKYIDDQGYSVVISAIAPYELLRIELEKICGCKFIFIDHDKFLDSDHPYEKPQNAIINVTR